MGLEIALIALTLASTAISVKGTLDEKKAVKAKAKSDARVERRNSVQQQVDIEHNKGVEKEAQKETVMEAAFQRSQVMKQARRERAATTAQIGRQTGLTEGPTIDAVLSDQMLDESLALQDIKFQEASKNQISRGVERGLSRDAFAVREIGETNAQAITAAGKNQSNALGLQALGQGLSGVSSTIGVSRSFT